MTLPFYQVDAFTSELFRGNPAAVIPLEKWLDDTILQNIAAENNLSETAFFVKEGDYYNIRWMTPTTEVPLCGHATLASAFVIFNFIAKDAHKIKFISKSGELFVDREGELLSLNFPANKPHAIQITDSIKKCFDKEPLEVLESETYLLLVFDSEDYIKNLEPDFELIKQIHPSSVIVSSKGREIDFVSRVFAPNEGIAEDPVTGSAHTVLVPYWSEKLRKMELNAHQISERGGELFCKDLGNRVKITGKAVLFLTGNICLDF